MSSLFRLLLFKVKIFLRDLDIFIKYRVLDISLYILTTSTLWASDSPRFYRHFYHIASRTVGRTEVALFMTACCSGVNTISPQFFIHCIFCMWLAAHNAGHSHRWVLKERSTLSSSFLVSLSVSVAHFHVVMPCRFSRCYWNYKNTAPPETQMDPEMWDALPKGVFFFFFPPGGFFL